MAWTLQLIRQALLVAPLLVASFLVIPSVVSCGSSANHSPKARGVAPVSTSNSIEPNSVKQAPAPSTSKVSWYAKELYTPFLPVPQGWGTAPDAVDRLLSLQTREGEVTYLEGKPLKIDLTFVDGKRVPFYVELLKHTEHPIAIQIRSETLTHASLKRAIEELASRVPLALEVHPDVLSEDNWIQTLPRLEALGVEFSEDSLKDASVIIGKIASLHQLRALSLLSYEDPPLELPLAALSGLKDLEILRLRRINSMEGWSFLNSLRRLRALDFTAGRLQAGFAESLATLPSLQGLDLSFSTITDSQLRTLCPLYSLSDLDLSDTSVSDAGFACWDGEPGQKLSALQELRSLNLGKTNVSDRVVAMLSGAIEQLILNDTKVSDAMAPHLARFSSLRRLSLNGTIVSGNLMETIATLVSLKRLDLSRTKLVDADLRHLRPLRTLERLAVGGMEIGDAGVAHLLPLDALRTLDVRATKVTDVGLRSLCKMQALELVAAIGAKVTSKGVASLPCSLSVTGP